MSNFDPDQHTGPGFVHEPPVGEEPGVPDCFGDADGDGMVGLPELLGVLASWGTDDWRYDIAPDGGDLTVDTADLLAVLSAWGPC